MILECIRQSIIESIFQITTILLKTLCQSILKIVVLSVIEKELQNISLTEINGITFAAGKNVLTSSSYRRYNDYLQDIGLCGHRTMKVRIYKWSKNTKSYSDKLCNMCGDRAVRSIYNDCRVGLTKPAWYACNKRKCYIMMAFLVLGDEGSPNKAG